MVLAGNISRLPIMARLAKQDAGVSNDRLVCHQNASQTQSSTSRTQLILVLSSSSLGRRKIRFGDRRPQPSPPRTVQTSRASSRHSIFPIFTSSLRTRAALAPVFQDLSPQLAYLRSTTCHGKIKKPTNHVPHECRFCPRVNPSNTSFGAPHHRPFEYILAVLRSRGPPRCETALRVSSESELELESEFDSEDLAENSGTDTSVFNPGASQTTWA